VEDDSSSSSQSSQQRDNRRHLGPNGEDEIKPPNSKKKMYFINLRNQLEEISEESLAAGESSR
jgi:hypothetical protein